MQYKSYIVEEDIDVIKESLVLFYGENLGLQNDIKSLIKKRNKDSEILYFTQDELLKNEDLLFNEILNISLFDKKKVFIIDQVSEKISKVIEGNFEKKIDHKLFFFAGLLEKKSKLRNFFEKNRNTAIIPCYEDNEITIKKLIIQKLKNFQGLTPNNINLILEGCGLDRIKLKNELKKINSFFFDRKIESDKLELLLDTKVNDNFNYLRDSALIGNKIKTNKLLSDTIIEQDKSVYYLNLINQRLNKLYEIQKIASTSSIEIAMNKIKPPIFWKEKNSILEQAKRWGKKKLIDQLNITYNLEINLKSNQAILGDLLIKKLIVDMCQKASL